MEEQTNESNEEKEMAQTMVPFPRSNVASEFDARWIPCASIHIDPRYQRSLIAGHVENLARNWNTSRAGAIDVSRREDNTYWVFDGSHRLAAAIKAGQSHIYCHVHPYSPAKEAEEFDALNSSAGRRYVLPIQRFKARLMARDSVAVAIEDIVQSEGFTLDLNDSHMPGSIGAIAELETYYRSGMGLRGRTEPTPDRLRSVLRLARDTWGMRPGGTAAVVLRALDVMIRRYGRNLDHARLVSKMQEHDPVLLQRRAIQNSKLMGNSSATCLALEMVKTYNSGLRSKRLPHLLGDDVSED